MPHALTINLPDWLWAELKDTARGQRCTRTSLAVACIQQALAPERGQPITDPFEEDGEVTSRAAPELKPGASNGTPAACSCGIGTDDRPGEDAAAHGRRSCTVPPFVGQFNPSESSVDYFEQRARERAERQDGNYAGYKG